MSFSYVSFYQALIYCFSFSWMLFCQASLNLLWFHQMSFCCVSFCQALLYHLSFCWMPFCSVSFCQASLLPFVIPLNCIRKRVILPSITLPFTFSIWSFIHSVILSNGIAPLKSKGLWLYSQFLDLDTERWDLRCPELTWNRTRSSGRCIQPGGQNKRSVSQ